MIRTVKSNCDISHDEAILPLRPSATTTPTQHLLAGTNIISGNKGVFVPKAQANPSFQKQDQDDFDAVRQERPSFRQVLTKAYTVVIHNESSHNMIVERKGDYLSVTIDNSIVQSGVSKLQHSLIEKLSLATGDKPYSLEALLQRLTQLWDISGP